jgi:hypothetical protein
MNAQSARQRLIRWHVPLDFDHLLCDRHTDDLTQGQYKSVRNTDGAFISLSLSTEKPVKQSYEYDNSPSHEGHTPTFKSILGESFC